MERVGARPPQAAERSVDLVVTSLPAPRAAAEDAGAVQPSKFGPGAVLGVFFLFGLAMSTADRLVPGDVAPIVGVLAFLTLFVLVRSYARRRRRPAPVSPTAGHEALEELRGKILATPVFWVLGLLNGLSLFLPRGVMPFFFVLNFVAMAILLGRFRHLLRPVLGLLVPRLAVPHLAMPRLSLRREEPLVPVALRIPELASCRVGPDGITLASGRFVPRTELDVGDVTEAGLVVTFPGDQRALLSGAAREVQTARRLLGPGVKTAPRSPDDYAEACARLPAPGMTDGFGAYRVSDGVDVARELAADPLAPPRVRIAALGVVAAAKDAETLEAIAHGSAHPDVRRVADEAMQAARGPRGPSA